MAYFSRKLDVSKVERGTADRGCIFIGRYADLQMPIEEARALAAGLEQVLTAIDREDRPEEVPEVAWVATERPSREEM